MPRLVPGASVGASKIMHVLMFLLVALISQENFMLVLDVGGHGVGRVVKNTAHNTVTLPRVHGCLQRKIVMTLHVA